MIVVIMLFVGVVAVGFDVMSRSPRVAGAPIEKIKACPPHMWRYRPEDGMLQCSVCKMKPGEGTRDE